MSEIRIRVQVNAFRDALLKAGVDARQTIYPGQGHAFFRNMAQVRPRSSYFKSRVLHTSVLVALSIGMHRKG